MGYRSPSDQWGPSASEDDLVLGCCVAYFYILKGTLRAESAFFET